MASESEPAWCIYSTAAIRAYQSNRASNLRHRGNQCVHILKEQFFTGAAGAAVAVYAWAMRIRAAHVGLDRN